MMKLNQPTAPRDSDSSAVDLCISLPKILTSWSASRRHKKCVANG